MFKLLFVIAVMSVTISVGWKEIELAYYAKDKLAERGIKQMLAEKYLAKLATKDPNVPLSTEVLSVVCDDFVITEPYGSCQVTGNVVTLCRKNVCNTLSKEWLEARLRSAL